MTGTRLQPLVARGLDEVKALPAAAAIVRVFDPDADVLDALAGRKPLRVLEIVCDEPPMEGLCARVARLTGLESVYLETRDEPIAVPELAALPLLQRVSLHKVPLTDEVLTAFARFPNLRELDLRGCTGLTVDSFSAFGVMPALRWFAYTSSPALPLTALSKLPGKERLTTLVCGHRRDLAPSKTRGGDFVVAFDSLTATKPSLGLETLRELTALETLSLSDNTLLTGKDLAHLGDLESLRSLDLSNCFQLTGADLRVLPKGLVRLDVSTTQLDSPLPSHLEALECLNIERGWKVTDDVVAAAARLPGLRALKLRACPLLTAECAGALAQANLVELDLTGAPWLDDDAVRALSAATTLQRLSLSGTREKGEMRRSADQRLVVASGPSAITATGVRALEALTDLRWLEIQHLPPIDEDAAAALRELPLEVLGAGGTALGADGGLDAWRKLLPGCRVVGGGEDHRHGRPLPDWDTGWVERLTKPRG